MAQNSFSDFSTSAASNTDYQSVGILGSSLVSTADDAFRAFGALTAKFYDDFGGVNVIGGTANAITITTPTTYTAYATGIRIRIIPASTNTGAVTGNLDAIGAKAIRKIVGGTDVALIAGDLAAKQPYDIVYDATANSAAGAFIVTTPQTINLTAQSRNRIVNGGMQISQENGTTSGTAAGYFPVDQWSQQITNSSGTFTAQQVASLTPGGSPNRFRMTVTVADAGLGAGDNLYFAQYLEGSAVYDLRYGTASAVQSVLRFGFKAPAGTYSIALRNGGTTRAYVVNFTITAPQANTDTLQTFVIPGDTTGTWLTGAGQQGLQVAVVLAAGSTYQTATVSAWQTVVQPALGTTSNTNGMTPISIVYELFDVGFYLDPNSTGVAPTFEVPDPAAELLRCMRYWWQITGLTNLFPISAGTTNGTTQFRSTVPLQVPMAVAPTITNSTIGNFSIRAGGVLAAASSLALQDTLPSMLTLLWGTSGVVSSNGGTVSPTNTTDFIKFSARL